MSALNLPALTAQQQEAVAARGNVLVVAGAGAGKTRTLVERCLAWLLDEQIQGSVDEILMVTFTQAAAAEMRQRLRDASNAPNRPRPVWRNNWRCWKRPIFARCTASALNWSASISTNWAWTRN